MLLWMVCSTCVLTISKGGIPVEHPLLGEAVSTCHNVMTCRKGWFRHEHNKLLISRMVQNTRQELAYLDMGNGRGNRLRHRERCGCRRSGCRRGGWRPWGGSRDPCSAGGRESPPGTPPAAPPSRHRLLPVRSVSSLDAYPENGFREWSLLLDCHYHQYEARAIWWYNKRCIG